MKYVFLQSKIRLTIFMLFILSIMHVKAQLKIGDLTVFASSKSISKSVKSEMFGKIIPGTEYTFTSNVFTQIACYMTHGEWDFVEDKYRITKFDDSDCVLFNTLKYTFRLHWAEQEECNNSKRLTNEIIKLGYTDTRYNYSSKFSVYPVVLILSYGTPAEAYGYIWHNKTLYKIETVEPSSWVNLNSFIKDKIVNR